MTDSGMTLREPCVVCGKFVEDGTRHCAPSLTDEQRAADDNKTLKFDEHTQKLRTELAKHYPVMVKDEDPVFTGHGECICGKAVANGTTPYCDIWAEHIRDVAKLKEKP